MIPVTERELFEALAWAPEAERERLIRTMTVETLLANDAKFEGWAHRNQLPPTSEGWSTWLMMAGRGYGKTRAGAEWIHALATSRPDVRIALVGASLAEARSIMVEGVSGLLAVARGRGARISWEPSLGRLSWPNGSQAQIFSGDHPDGLRGPEHDFAWCAAGPRCAGRANGGDAARRQPPAVACRRVMLYRGKRGDWRVGGHGRSSGRVHARRLALLRAIRGSRRACEKHRGARGFQGRRMGAGNRARRCNRDRRRASGRQQAGRDRRSQRGDDRGQCGSNGDQLHARRVARAWTYRPLARSVPAGQRERCGKSGPDADPSRLCVTGRGH